MARLTIKATLDEMALIEKIAHRCVPMSSRANISIERERWAEIISLCHAATPLDLEALYTAPDREFAQDVFGMRNYMHPSGQWFTEWRPACRIENGKG